MSENDYEFVDYPLTAVDMNTVIFPDNIEVAKAELMLMPHSGCDNPDHINGTVEKVILLMITDIDGKDHVLAMHPKSSVAADIGSGLLGLRVTLVAKTC
jgi:hypothetical protein